MVFYRSMPKIRTKSRRKNNRDMSLFDKDLDENEEPLRKRLREEDFIASCLSFGAIVVECDDPKTFISRLEEIVSPDAQIIGTEVAAEMLKKQQGRPIVKWDVRTFKKYDAVGSMHVLSKRSDKPIIIIENITDIPEKTSGQFDEPTEVENILLHSWENDILRFDSDRFGSFQLNRLDYTVIFPVLKGSLKHLHHRLEDGIAYIVEE